MKYLEHEIATKKSIVEVIKNLRVIHKHLGGYEKPKQSIAIISAIEIIEHQIIDKWKDYSKIKKWLLQKLNEFRYESPHVEIIIVYKNCNKFQRCLITSAIKDIMPVAILFEIKFIEQNEMIKLKWVN